MYFSDSEECHNTSTSTYGNLLPNKYQYYHLSQYTLHCLFYQICSYEELAHGDYHFGFEIQRQIYLISASLIYNVFTVCNEFG